jgi:hypothetical protein
MAVVLAGALCVLPVRGAGAGPPPPDLDHINVTYHGGALLTHVRVSTLFWGGEWVQSPLVGFFNQFFTDLFADGRYLANLAQYSSGDYQIGNGEFVATATDPQEPPAVVTDDQTQAEVRAQILAGKLPPPDANTIYAVFTPSGVVVEDSLGDNSATNLLAYHDFSYARDDNFTDAGDGQEGNFAYLVVPTVKNDAAIQFAQQDTPHLATAGISHELAEAVTDPEPSGQDLGQGGWYDAVGHNGEIGDIVVNLYDYDRIKAQDLFAVLDAPGGGKYLVQKEWSNKDGAPVAFAAAPASAAAWK